MTVSSIALIFAMVFQKLVKCFSVLRALTKLGSRLLRSRKIPVESLLLSAFVRLGRGLIVPMAANIYPSDPRQKVESFFDLCSEDFFDGLLLGVLLTVILLDLGMNKGL